MSRLSRTTVWFVAGLLMVCEASFAQRGLIAGKPAPVVISYPAPFDWFGGYSAYGGYGFPGFGYPVYGTPYSYIPDHWWAGPYASTNPRQDGYNPSAGYEWDSVGTLILTTLPEKSRITLDGVFVGTCDMLGPFQLPAGDHTLRVEAQGYEPSETLVKVDQPGVQELEVQLQPVTATAKPAPRS